MLLRQLYRRPGTIAAVALTFAAASVASAQSRIVLPAGSVIIVRTTAPLQSTSAQTGQTFETNVEGSIGVDEFTVIPSGSTIRGVVSAASRATRQQSGVIDVVFDRLTLPNGTSYAISGRLTSTDSAERRQIESDPNARVVLVGERGGIGAAIAGAGSQKGSNNILAALGSMLSEGRDVNVPSGTQLAVRLDNAVTLRAGNRMRGTDEGTIYTAAERVTAAQQALARLNYYRGPVNGVLNDATRRALFQFQVDRGLSGTGNLDYRTAQALGIDLSGGGTTGTLSGNVLSASQAAAVRRDADYAVTRIRTDLGASSVGRLNQTRAYSQTDLDLWFALSAFADNAAIYEQIVNGGGNRDAAVLAGRSLSAAAHRVDAALQSARTSAPLQNYWSAIRRQLASIDNTATTY